MARLKNIFPPILGRLFAGALYCFCQAEVLAASELTRTLSAGEMVEVALDSGNLTRLEELARDPFWPIRWRPEKISQTEEEEEVSVETGSVDYSGLTLKEQAVIKSRMRVGGILVQKGTCVAIINDRVVREGNMLTMDANDQSYEFIVKLVTPSKIILKPSR